MWGRVFSILSIQGGNVNEYGSPGLWVVMSSDPGNWLWDRWDVIGTLRLLEVRVEGEGQLFHDFKDLQAASKRLLFKYA